MRLAQSDLRLFIWDVEYKLTLVPKGYPDWKRVTAPTLETHTPFADETSPALDPTRLPTIGRRLVHPDEGSIHAMGTLVYRKTLDPVAIHYKIGKKTIILPSAHKPRPSS
ncbi:BQ5605_C003g01937 [Microbotryum silenes-dioicae]|uniref:BQ5605_C003g01937 protein n=1 Tax=Microbotryum silenes-dioicae TaxID=796604 RepID=A0A2X0MM99_9BASI|nr:BQ5605_C003g01937 [Microbotryum silenes-dioicae]